jgi:hypothetical protein
MTVSVLLVVIIVLLFTRRPARDYTVGVMILIAAGVWLAIEIGLISMLGEVFALAAEHWIKIVVALASAVLLIVPAIMISVAVRDRFGSREKARDSRSTVRYKFERRVNTLMGLGYGRTEAETTAFRLLRRDLNYHSDAKKSR